MRKLIALLAGLIFTINLTSCTSSDSKDEFSGDEAVAESTEGTDGDLENLDAPAADSSAVASSDGASDGFLDEQLPEDALGESTKTADATPPAEPALEDSMTAPPAMEEPKADAIAEAAPPTEAEMAPPLDTPPPTDTAAIDTATPPPETDTTSIGSLASSEPPPEAPPAPIAEAKPKASLKKIETTPLHRNGLLLNAVYVVRPKDNYSKISKLIYGDSSKVKELKKANPGVVPRVGDKVYYNSPTRPTDDTKVLTYYEDVGMVPEVYVAQEGDNLKKVAKKVLGFDNAWKEIWATNGIESKDSLAAGTEIRYWKSAPAPTPAPVVAHNEALPPAPVNDMAMNQPPPVEAQPMPDLPPPPPAEMAPPPPMPTAQNELPPPPPAEMAPPPPAPDMAAQPDLPPPPPAEAVNPPPPPPMPKKSPSKDMAGEGMDNDMVMTLAGAGIILAGLAAVILIRRRRQSRDMASAFNDTQVGT